MGIGFENTEYARTLFHSQIPRCLKYMKEGNDLKKKELEAYKARTQAVVKQTEAIVKQTEAIESLMTTVADLTERLRWIK